LDQQEDLKIKINDEEEDDERKRKVWFLFVLFVKEKIK